MSLYFGKALPMAEKKNDYWALATIYNSLGGNTAFGEGDYSQGIAYLMEALRYAENIRDTSRLMLVKNNLAMAYCFRSCLNLLSNYGVKTTQFIAST